MEMEAGMPQLSSGVQFMVQSKTTQQSHWQTESEHEVTAEVTIGTAYEQALESFASAVASGSGSGREYRLLQCNEMMYEVQ